MFSLDFLPESPLGSPVARFLPLWFAFGRLPLLNSTCGPSSSKPVRGDRLPPPDLRGILKEDFSFLALGAAGRSLTPSAMLTVLTLDGLTGGGGEGELSGVLFDGRGGESTFLALLKASPGLRLPDRSMLLDRFWLIALADEEAAFPASALVSFVFFGFVDDVEDEELEALIFFLGSLLT